MVNSKGVKRNVYNHNIYDVSDFIYDIDSDPQYLQSNLHDSSINHNIEAYYSKYNSRTCLTLQQWQSLSDDGKQAWNNLDHESKQIVLDSKVPPDRQSMQLSQNKTQHQRKSDR